MAKRIGFQWASAPIRPRLTVTDLASRPTKRDYSKEKTPCEMGSFLWRVQWGSTWLHAVLYPLNFTRCKHLRELSLHEPSQQASFGFAKICVVGSRPHAPRKNPTCVGFYRGGSSGARTHDTLLKRQVL